MGDDLGKLAFTIRLSRAAKRVIAQNIGFALVVKHSVPAAGGRGDGDALGGGLRRRRRVAHRHAQRHAPAALAR